MYENHEEIIKEAVRNTQNSYDSNRVGSDGVMINISYNAERLVVYVNHNIVSIKYYGELDLVLKARIDLIAQFKELGYEVQ